MQKMTKQNLNHIKDRFQRETGTQLPETKAVPVRTLALVAAVLVMGMALAAFTYPLFTPLNGDELTLGGTYLGDGIVSVHVENRSDKVLTFTDARLYSWSDGEVAPIPGGQVSILDPKVEPHGEGVLTVDLSEAYDIAFLETTTPGKPKESWYYLLLTNNDFLYGHDWMCSFHFVKEEPAVEETRPPVKPQSVNLEGIPEELRFYFEKPYYDVLPAFNEAHFNYQQKVQELLLRTEGTFVRPLDPMLLVEPPKTGVMFDEAVPEEEQYWLVHQGYSSLDGYRRMVGSAFSGVTSDFSLQLGGTVPQEEGEADGATIPLIFLFTYDAEAVRQEAAYAFVCGRILYFDGLEENRVYADEAYVVYDLTELFYDDLDAYIDAFVSGNSLYCDDAVRQQLHNIRDYYQTRVNLTFYYNLPKE